MKEIIIKSNKYGEKKVLLDDDIFEELSKFTWCAQKFGNHFYAMRKSPRTKSIIMHRLLMGVTDRKVYVDHIDGNGLNNQMNNLRIATHSENLCNRGSTKGAGSKYKGVCWVKSHKLWRAGIQKDNVPVLLGYFKSEIEAAYAYDTAAKIYHGQFASLNFK